MYRLIFLLSLVSFTSLKASSPYTAAANRAVDLQLSGKLGDAESAWDKAYEQAPGNNWIALEYGRFLRRLNKLDAAHKILSNALVTSKGTAVEEFICVELGFLCAQKGDYDGASSITLSVWKNKSENERLLYDVALIEIAASHRKNAFIVIACLVERLQESAQLNMKSEFFDSLDEILCAGSSESIKRAKEALRKEFRVYP